MPILAVLALGAAAVVAAGTLGQVHGVFDSLAHFRAEFAALAAVAGVLVMLRRGRGRLRVGGAIGATVGLVGLASVAPYVVPRSATTVAAGEPTYALLQMNLLWTADIGLALDRIRQLQPEIVTLQEVSRDMVPAIAALTDYAVVRCDMGWLTVTTMVLSRAPLAGEPWCAEDGRTAIQPIELGGRTVTVVSQHLSHPWPRDQAAELSALAPTLLALQGPVIVGGDFNAAPWSEAVATYARLSGTAPVTGIGFTWPHVAGAAGLTAWLGLPIDNVLFSPELMATAARRPGPTNSDHLPVHVRFTLRHDGDATIPVAMAH